jgi:hypothetical protein
MGAAPIVIPQACPAGTTDLGNGTCQEPARTVMGAAPIVVNQPCPVGTTDLGNGTCEAPARIIESAPIYTPAQPVCHAGTAHHSSSCVTLAPTHTAYESGHSVPDTVVHSQEGYCYGDGKRMYDDKGREIPGARHSASSCKSHH